MAFRGGAGFFEVSVELCSKPDWAQRETSSSHPRLVAYGTLMLLIMGLTHLLNGVRSSFVPPV